MPTTVGEGTQTHTLMHWLCGEHVFGGARAHRQAMALTHANFRIHTNMPLLANFVFFIFRKQAWAALCSGVVIFVLMSECSSVWRARAQPKEPDTRCICICIRMH